MDDDRSVRESLRRVLESEDYVVVTATGGKDALELLQDQQPDLVITDLFMALISGWLLIDYLANNHPTLPIFVVSAHAAESLKDRRQHVAAFFQKPLDIPELLADIRALSERSANPAASTLPGGDGHVQA